MVRLRLDLAYDGGAFYGWAKQPTLRTVQGELEQALHTILRVSADDPDEPLRLTVAGRTDTGVHALHQVCHLDVGEATWTAAWAIWASPRRRRCSGGCPAWCRMTSPSTR